MHSLFGAKHLIILSISVAMILIGTVVAKKWTLQKLAKTLLAIGLVSEFIKIFYYIIANESTHGGILPKTDLPFHLCSIQIIFTAVLGLSQTWSGSSSLTRWPLISAATRKMLWLFSQGSQTQRPGDMV